MENVEVGILTGLNCPSALRARDVVHGNEDEPYAVKSLLAWHMNSPVHHDTCDAVSCNKVRILTDSSEMFEMEFCERQRGVGLSQEDRKFLEKVDDGICHGEDAHYEMPFPFKNENSQLPNNRHAAEQYLNGLRASKRPEVNYYATFMNGIIDKRYARKTEQDELTRKSVVHTASWCVSPTETRQYQSRL